MKKIISMFITVNFLIILAHPFLFSIVHQKQPFNTFTQHVTPTPKESNKPINPSVLFIHLSSGMGGSETTSSAMYELMYKNGFNCTMLVPENSPLDELLSRRKLPHHCNEQSKNRIDEQISLAHQIRSLCLAYNINIVQYFIPTNFKIINKAIKDLSIKTVLLRHVAEPIAPVCLYEVTGVIAVSPTIEAYIKKINRTDHLKIKNITTIFPFFDEEKFLYYQPPSISREDFFKTECGISVSKEPVICSIANFYAPTLHKKNQELLLKALYTLIYEKNRKAHILFIGAGPDLERHKLLCKELNLENYAHFLGFRDDTTDLLYFSDFHVLPSITEAFGIVHLESALLRKASIGATQTGSEHVIIHGTTGLLFKNNDCNDLVCTLEVLLDNPDTAKKFGQNAYDFVTARNFFTKNGRTPFLKQQKFALLKNFYTKLLKS